MLLNHEVIMHETASLRLIFVCVSCNLNVLACSLVHMVKVYIVQYRESNPDCLSDFRSNANLPLLSDPNVTTPLYVG